MPAITLDFWGWDKPILPKAIAALSKVLEENSEGLSSTLILTPTAETGRRLREALASHAAESEGAVSVPYVWHPEMALTWGQDREKFASRCQERLVWTSLLKRMKRGRYDTLFPALAEPVSSTWAMAAAETLADLAQLLGAGGHSMASAAVALKDHEDAARWVELAALESEYLAALSAQGLEDIQAAKRRGVATPQLPEGIQRIFIFAVADPPVLLRTWLRQVAEKVDLHICIQAPESMRAGFDLWGFPRPEIWGELTPGYQRDVPDECLILAPKPQDQARVSVAHLRELLERKIPASIGVCNPALGRHLESALAAEGVRAYDPADKLALGHRAVALIRSWMDFSQSRAWKPMAAFLRLHDVHEALASEMADFKRTAFLGQLDKALADHLPATIEDALLLLPEDEFLMLREALKIVLGQLEAWSSGGGCQTSLRGLLEWIYGSVLFKTHLEDDAEMARLMGETITIASTLDRISAGLGPSLSSEDLQALLLAEVERIVLNDTRGEVDLVLSGWLEMLWEPAPGLVLAGFNEEHVPGIIVSHAFLPDSLRRELGLSSQQSRRARDAYLLAAIVEQRRRSGAVRIVIGRLDDEDNTLKPSRLLFNCSDQALPGRVQLLFPKDREAAENSEPAWDQSWLLRPRYQAPDLRSISASWIESYLACPFRFYLNNVLRMDSIDPAQRELSRFAFGTLIHQVLADFGRYEPAANEHTKDSIADWLDARLTQLAGETWGTNPFFTVALQIESARQRLRAVAAQLADLRGEGWRIEAPELKITQEWGLKLAGVPFTGRIDRLDVLDSPEGKVYRIWDFKTSANAPSAFGRPRAEDLADPWRCVLHGNSNRRWKDLQLFLYAWAVAKHFKDATRVEAGYLMMPSAVSGVRRSLVDEVTDDSLIDNAIDVAEEVVLRIRQGIFWPPSAQPKYDDASELWLAKGPERTVDEAWMNAMKS